MVLFSFFLFFNGRITDIVDGSLWYILLPRFLNGYVSREDETPLHNNKIVYYGKKFALVCCVMPSTWRDNVSVSLAHILVEWIKKICPASLIISPQKSCVCLLFKSYGTLAAGLHPLSSGTA